MRLTTVIRWAVVGGAIIECLVFGGYGASNLWWGVANRDRVEGLADLVSNVISVGILALAAGFGLGAFLLSLRLIGLRIAGAVFHLVATALAAWVLIWAGLYQMRVDPNSEGYWSPGLAFAVAAAVIAIGVAVLLSLFLPVQRQGKSQAAAG